MVEFWCNFGQVLEEFQLKKREKVAQFEQILVPLLSFGEKCAFPPRVFLFAHCLLAFPAESKWAKRAIMNQLIN